jgi:hypothetical protein
LVQDFRSNESASAMYRRKHIWRLIATDTFNRVGEPVWLG